MDSILFFFFLIVVSIPHLLFWSAGWVFPEKETAGATPDTVNGCRSMRELYLKADPNYRGKVRARNTP